MYKNIIFLIVPTLFFTACVNKRGIAASYYNQCTEYYDARSYYHKECDENLVEFKGVKENIAKTYHNAKDFMTFSQELEKKPQHKVVW